jgi:hypothetical protein
MIRRAVGFTLVAALLVCCIVTTTYADSPLKSSNFEIDESTIGAGGLTQENSSNFQAGEFIGDLAVGSSSSTNFQLNAGYDTTSDPALTFIIGSSVNFNDFSPTAAATATSTFQVIDYTSYGYVVQIMGTAPTNGGHVITPMSTTGVSQAGVEQFGINLVANSSPTTVGADPNNGLFGVGEASTNYNTANHYRYVSGETIADGPKSSGSTIYTISYIVNATSLTPGGKYTSQQTLVCTGTY